MEHEENMCIASKTSITSKNVFYNLNVHFYKLKTFKLYGKLKFNYL